MTLFGIYLVAISYSPLFLLPEDLTHSRHFICLLLHGIGIGYQCSRKVGEPVIRYLDQENLTEPTNDTDLTSNWRNFSGGCIFFMVLKKT